MQRTFALGTLFIAVQTLLVIPTMRADADPSCAVPSNGDLTIQELPEGSSVSECDVVGREVTFDGIELTIPSPGEGVMMEVFGPDEVTSFAVHVSNEGDISYVMEDLSEPGRVLLDSDPVECSQGQFEYRGEEIFNTLTWHIGDDPLPAGLSPASFEAIAKDSIYSWRNAYNDCEIADKITQLSISFGGSTSKETDFYIENADSKCSDRDGTSTIDAGNLDRNGEPPVASECTWFRDNSAVVKAIIESDIRFNTTNYDFTTSPLSSSCNEDNQDYDVRSVMTHEFGHTIGLGHVAEDDAPRMTMSTASNPCTRHARTLGKGDILGAQYMYCSNDNCHSVRYE